MAKVAVVFWSGSGNTESMASYVEEGVLANGGEAALFTAADFNADMMADYDGIAYGCPAMGDEVLEEEEFEPMFEACKANLKDKKIALFGSYGWGDGEWMRNWEAACKECGAVLVADPVIANYEPDDEAAEACRNIGKAF